MLPIRVRSDAEQDIREAFRWYEDQYKGLGGRFLDNLDVVLERIARYPKLHAETYRGVRQTLVRKFPYLVCYLELPDEIEVLAVLHAGRDPSDWQSRVARE